MATGMMGDGAVLGTQDWWAAQGEADGPGRAEVQAYDLARSLLYGHDYREYFAGRLDEHLRDTGIKLPIRVGGREITDDGSGGFLVSKVRVIARNT
jgi:hypothetical protein